MLKRLVIQNFALIEKAELGIDKGFTVITGETGAGKSILLGALGLVLGQRADSSALSDKTKKCVVEAEINIANYGLENIFTENDIDFSSESIFRREINPNGNSRAFINDSPVNINVLKEIASGLIDIHSQHQTLTIANNHFQLSVLDSFSKNDTLLKDYQKLYKAYKKLHSELHQLEEAESMAKKEQDFIQFQFDELEQAGLYNINQKEIEDELNLLNNAEQIKSNLTQMLNIVQEGEVNSLSGLKEAKNLLSAVAQNSEKIKSQLERLNSVLVELKDIAADIEAINEEIIHDPNKIELLNSRLDVLYRLQKKHGLQSTEELIQLRNELSEKLFTFSSLEENILKLRKEIEKQKAELNKTAAELSKSRKKNIPQLEKNILQNLNSLGMENSRIEFTAETLEDFDNTGTDKIKILFSANKGGDLKELGKVASGGELSRLMLSLKYILSKTAMLPTILFDEIDTGVSGDVADKMGKMMQEMAKTMQIISITHLPQIAAKGNEHWFVYKEHGDTHTSSRIKQLKNEERILEIAKMLSNNKPSEAAISNAKELLSVA